MRSWCKISISNISCEPSFLCRCHQLGKFTIFWCIKRLNVANKNIQFRKGHQFFGAHTPPFGAGSPHSNFCLHLHRADYDQTSEPLAGAFYWKSDGAYKNFLWSATKRTKQSLAFTFLSMMLRSDLGFFFPSELPDLPLSPSTERCRFSLRLWEST